MEAATVTALLEIPSSNPITYCRLCLSSSLVEPLYPCDPKQDLINLIAKNVHVVLMIEEDLPCAVCQNCRFKLEDFERFRDQCQKLDNFIRTRKRELALLQEAVAVPQLDTTGTLMVSETIDIKADPEALLGDEDSLPYVLTEDSWHRCKFCSEAFQSLSVLLEHFKMRHPDESKMYKCPNCSQTYSVECSGSSSPAFKCDECDAGFSNRVGLSRHKDRYHDKSSPNYSTERHKCDYCPSMFVDSKQRSKHQIQMHISTSGGTKNTAQVDGIHVCEKCAVTFSPYQALLVHIQEHHWNDPPQETFSCSVCSKPFDKRRLLQYHILVAHLGQIPYACNHCGEWFRTKSHLKQHKTMFHERAMGDANRCEFCGQIFEEESKDPVQ
ncbi:zinc finger protein 502-like [Topomyia yanbarensis]|uniref:zinc finger protein 502-like n=1 Tax=Topomyia yanbarensis TaxID=2498891 RepID=UPI00273B2499|nr:zinc finger protein 502-like [Topomyia yanbarensis]